VQQVAVPVPVWRNRQLLCGEIITNGGFFQLISGTRKKREQVKTAGMLQVLATLAGDDFAA
jgi:hypothetical protein